MSDYTNKELLEAIYEVRDRVTRIEEKLNRAEKLEEKVDQLDQKINSVKDLAEDAFSMAEANQDGIKAMKESTKWIWSFIIPVAIALIAQVLGVKI